MNLLQHGWESLSRPHDSYAKGAPRAYRVPEHEQLRHEVKVLNDKVRKFGHFLKYNINDVLLHYNSARCSDTT